MKKYIKWRIKITQILEDTPLWIYEISMKNYELIISIILVVPVL